MVKCDHPSWFAIIMVTSILIALTWLITMSYFDSKYLNIIESDGKKACEIIWNHSASVIDFNRRLLCNIGPVKSLDEYDPITCEGLDQMELYGLPFGYKAICSDRNKIIFEKEVKD